MAGSYRHITDENNNFLVCSDHLDVAEGPGELREFKVPPRDHRGNWLCRKTNQWMSSYWHVKTLSVWSKMFRRQVLTQ